MILRPAGGESAVSRLRQQTRENQKAWARVRSQACKISNPHTEEPEGSNSVALQRCWSEQHCDLLRDTCTALCRAPAFKAASRAESVARTVP